MRFDLHLGRGWLTSESALVKLPKNRNDANGYYSALGLSPGATHDEIKRAYRRLVKKLHPDVGGDEELFRFVSEIANVLLSHESKSYYDSIDGESVYLGRMEQEEMARLGIKVLIPDEAATGEALSGLHWACLTTGGFSPGIDTDRWIELCREVSPAIGYRGRIQAGVLEGGENWPCDPSRCWGVFQVDHHSSFVVFQRGVEPSRLIALCAMIEWFSVR